MANILNSTDYSIFPSSQKVLVGSTVLEIEIKIKKSIDGFKIRLNKAKQKVNKLEKMN